MYIYTHPPLEIIKTGYVYTLRPLEINKMGYFNFMQTLSKTVLLLYANQKLKYQAETGIGEIRYFVKLTSIFS